MIRLLSVETNEKLSFFLYNTNLCVIFVQVPNLRRGSNQSGIKIVNAAEGVGSLAAAKG